MFWGLVHGELTSLLWGGAFGFLWLYTVVARFFAARYPRVRRPTGALSVDSDNVLVFTADRPPTPAFFHWWLKVEAVHSPTRHFEHRVLLLDGENSLPLALPRGSYQITVVWELADVFGFTKLVPRASWATVLTVVPLALPFTAPRPPATRPGQWRPRRTGRRAGDPFDVRHYVPGDDLRRLHWPLLAHAGDLFVRTAEPSPPPSGHQFLVLDTEAKSEEELDLRLGQLTTWLTGLDTQGTGWTLAVPAYDTLLTPGDPVGSILAGLSPTPLPDQPVPPSWPATVTLLTGTSSRGAALWSRRLAATRRRFQAVQAEPPARSPETVRPWWRRP